MASKSKRGIGPRSTKKKNGSFFGSSGRNSVGSIAPRRVFVVACEGKKTERNYFKRLAADIDNVTVRFVPARSGRTPSQLVQDMRNHLGDYGQDYLCKDSKPRAFELDFDEAWIVFDKDEWKDYQLQEVYDWSKSDRKFDFAMSNPKFEYWLTLHFEDGKSEEAKGIRSCVRHLTKHHIPKYSKSSSLPEKMFKNSNLENAINRARSHDNSKDDKWPCHQGCTTVYRLVENILYAK